MAQISKIKYSKPMSKGDINHLCFRSCRMFRVFLPNNYPKNVIPNPPTPTHHNLAEEPCCLLTPPPTRVIAPASCSLGLAMVVSVLVELCDVGGKRPGVGGSRVECCSSEGERRLGGAKPDMAKRQNVLKALVHSFFNTGQWVCLWMG